MRFLLESREVGDVCGYSWRSIRSVNGSVINTSELIPKSKCVFLRIFSPSWHIWHIRRQLLTYFLIFRYPPRYYQDSIFTLLQKFWLILWVLFSLLSITLKSRTRQFQVNGSVINMSELILKFTHTTHSQSAPSIFLYIDTEVVSRFYLHITTEIPFFPRLIGVEWSSDPVN